MEDEYLYTPLQKGEIRLLEVLPGQPEAQLQCHLRIVSLADADTLPSYAAVSYTWGEGLSDRTIMVGGQRLSVKPNLEAALFEFRREPPRLIPEGVEEEVLATMGSLKSLGARYYESFSAASRSDYDELMKAAKASYASLRDSSDEEDIGPLQTPFVKEIERRWNQIADRECVSRFYEEPVLLWIDGICIHQNDNTERSAQVGMMGKIYAKAKYLVVWLCPRNEKTDVALSFFDLWKEEGRKSVEMEVYGVY